MNTPLQCGPATEGTEVNFSAVNGDYYEFDLFKIQTYSLYYGLADHGCDGRQITCLTRKCRTDQKSPLKGKNYGFVQEV